MLKRFVFPMKKTRLTTTPPSLSPPPVCPLNTSPCVRSTRPRVCRHHAHTCFDTFARGTSTHGDVLNVHTETCYGDTRVFQRVAHHTPHTTPHTHHTTTQDATYHTTTTRQQHLTLTETERNRDRQRHRREERREKREEREERRFIFSVVMHGRSLFMECFVLLNPSRPIP